MKEGFKMLKKYMVVPVHHDLCNENFAPSFFMHHFNQIFEDEEIFNNERKLEKCFYCLSDDIEIEDVDSDCIYEYVTENTSYNLKIQMKVYNDLVETCKYYELDYLKITYCKKCRRIIAVNDVPYVFYFNVLELLHTAQYDLMKTEGTFGEFDSVVRCPRCLSYNVKHVNAYYDEAGETEYECRCTDCNYTIDYFSYGAVELPEPAQNSLLYEHIVSKMKLPFN